MQHKSSPGVLQGIRVYVAGPISSDPEQGKLNALVVATKLRDAGHNPYVPHFSVDWDKLHPAEYETWMRIGSAWLEAADAVVVLPGESPGTDREVAIARELGIPIFGSVRSLTDWASGEEDE